TATRRSPAQAGPAAGCGPPEAGPAGSSSSGQVPAHRSGPAQTGSAEAGPATGRGPAGPVPANGSGAARPAFLGAERRQDVAAPRPKR
ncbi:MAG: hypothetical protein F4072_09605, partial [Acidimicrobiaceae bacterium]|nr:hypothetical protein [Acidimicrobiaceae bacterium]